jgi:hypothetical protein
VEQQLYVATLITETGLEMKIADSRGTCRLLIHVAVSAAILITPKY